MFAGIVEAQSQIKKTKELKAAVQVWFSKPDFFNDIKIGDSISCNGICLTVEDILADLIQFTIAHETLSLLDLDQNKLSTNYSWNLERSLRFGDRIHGHLVSGHVEGKGQVLKSEALGDSWILSVQIPNQLAKWVWKKGCIAINGVSLTVNSFENNLVEVCLIPETQKRTNLAQLKVGDHVNIETDYLAKAVLNGRSLEI